MEYCPSAGSYANLVRWNPKLLLVASRGRLESTLRKLRALLPAHLDAKEVLRARPQLLLQSRHMRHNWLTLRQACAEVQGAMGRSGRGARCMCSLQLSRAQRCLHAWSYCGQGGWRVFAQSELAGIFWPLMDSFQYSWMIIPPSNPTPHCPRPPHQPTDLHRPVFLQSPPSVPPCPCRSCQPGKKS